MSYVANLNNLIRCRLTSIYNMQICISACKDAQIAWEDDDGTSMTLVRFFAAVLPNYTHISISGTSEDFKKNTSPFPQGPYASSKVNALLKLSFLSAYMINDSHQTHERCVQVHKKTQSVQKMLRKKKKHYSRTRGDSFIGEINNFQDPQVASHVPLVCSTVGLSP